MEVKIHSSIDEVEESRWNALTGANRLICTHRYLKAVEQSRINDCRYFYPVAYENGEIMAHACVYFISTELDAFAKGFLKKAIHGIRRLWPSFLVMRSLECGTPVALGHTFSFRPGVQQKETLLLLVRAIEQLAQSLDVRILLFRDFQEENRLFHNAFLNEGFRPIKNLPCARLAIRWKSFDDYVNSMRSPYRHKVLLRKQKCASGGIRFERAPDFEPFADDLAQLWMNAYQHASEYKREILRRDFFANINNLLGDRSSAILAKREDQIAGFALLLHDDSTLEWLFCGMDYRVDSGYCLYFNLIYQIIEFAIQRGFKEVNLGITTLIPKMDAGAHVEPLHMYMKHSNPALNRIVPRFFTAMTPSCKETGRAVFKELASQA